MLISPRTDLSPALEKFASQSVQIRTVYYFKYKYP